MEANSINACIEAFIDQLKERSIESLGRWSLQIFEPETAVSGILHQRTTLIEEGIANVLKKKLRSYLKLRVSDGISADTVVQLCVLSGSKAWVSFSQRAPDSLPWQRSTSGRRAGYFEVPDDRSAPSRAFKKVEEAAEIFPLRIEAGAKCIDLGASPGGWSYTLLNRGCRVHAIDRAPLAESIMRHPQLSFEKGNALSWQPAEPVDWLFCDVITTPDRTFEVVQRWVKNGWCRNFCVSLKFQGEPDTSLINSAKYFCERKLEWYGMKQMIANKNEVTLAGGSESQVARE
jgi:23S rRNA (cytidine2498-2'-O)-methyltransferase